MRLNTLNIAVPCFLLLTSVAATFVALTPGSADNWVINPLTGLTAIAFCILAFARLFVGAPSIATKRIWIALIAVFCTVAVGQFLEAYEEAIQQVFGIDDVANCVLLVVSPITLWMISRFDPPPLFARGLFMIGFVLQAVSTLLDVVNAILIAHWNQDVAFIDLITDFGQFISLQIYLGAVAVFLVSLHLHQHMRLQGARTVGDLSRYLFVRLRLINKLRHPELRVPGIEFGLWIFHFFAWVPVVGPQVRALHGRSIRRQLWDICKLGLTSGMDAQAYYVFEFYRDDALRFSGDYLTQFETRNGLFEAVSGFIARPLKGSGSPLRDKLKFGSFCTVHGLPSIPVLWLSEGRSLEQSSDVVSRLSRDVFLTARRHDDRRVTDRLYRHIGAERYVSDDGVIVSAAELFALATQSAGRTPLILQPRLVCHADLAGMAAGRGMRIFVVTCLTSANTIDVTHAILRISPDAAASREAGSDVSAAIHTTDGRIGALVRYPSRSHQPPPAANWTRQIHVENQAIPQWQQIRQLAVDAHQLYRDRFVIEWEIACTPVGPVLAGASENPDVERLQQAYGQPIGQSALGDHLVTYLRLLEDQAAGRLRPA